MLTQPLSLLKTERERQAAWELARKHRKDFEALTAGEVASAAALMFAVSTVQTQAIEKDQAQPQAEDTVAATLRQIHCCWETLKEKTNIPEKELAELWLEYLTSRYGL